MKLVSFRVDIISHLKRSCLLSSSLSLFLLLSCIFVLRNAHICAFFAWTMPEVSPRSQVTWAGQRRSRSWAGQRINPAPSKNAKRFCLTLHLTRHEDKRRGGPAGRFTMSTRSWAGQARSQLVEEAQELSPSLLLSRAHCLSLCLTFPLA